MTGISNKEMDFIKSLPGGHKIEVDLEAYCASDQSIESQRIIEFVDRMIELKLGEVNFTLTKSDIFMFALALGLTPVQYEFFYNKHMLVTAPLTNKGE
jgi:hypothetical protein